MIRQCANCLVVMGEKAPLTDTSITHGICWKCAVKQLRKAGIVVTKKMIEQLKAAA